MIFTHLKLSMSLQECSGIRLFSLSAQGASDQIYPVCAQIGPKIPFIHLIGGMHDGNAGVKTLMKHYQKCCSRPRWHVGLSNNRL